MGGQVVRTELFADPVDQRGVGRGRVAQWEGQAQGVVLLREPTTVDEVNDAFRGAAKGLLHGILRVSDAPLVSRDIIGDPASCIVDAPLTQVHGRLVKVFGWYDNEWGYTNRLLDLTEYVAARLDPR